MRNVYYEKGTLLAYNNIFLNEGPSPAGAYRDAIDLAQRRTRPLNYVHRDITIGCGPVDQTRGQVPYETMLPTTPIDEPRSESLPEALPDSPPPAAPEAMPSPEQTSLSVSALESALDVAEPTPPPVALPTDTLFGFER